MNKFRSITLNFFLLFFIVSITFSIALYTKKYSSTISNPRVNFTEAEMNMNSVISHITCTPIPRDKEAAKAFVQSLFKKMKVTNNENSTLSSIYIRKSGRLGNNIVQLTNALIISEALGLENVYVPYNFCMIKKTVTDKEKRINIIPSNSIPDGATVIKFPLFRMSHYDSNPSEWTKIFASEILKNVHHFNTDNEDLYIHIRSGDVYRSNPSLRYGQPPLCFYESIIKRWGFKKIYILSEDTRSPVIKPLTNKYRAKLIQADLLKTLGYILSAKNLVVSWGTFIPSLLRLVPADPEKRIFKYGNITAYGYDIWREYFFMNPSDYYRKNILWDKWRNSEEQKKIMLNETCDGNWFISTHTECLTP